MTKEGIKLVLKKWGKKYKKSWWEGGNFNHRVFDEFLEKKGDFFIVNQKGKLKITELISELRK